MHLLTLALQSLIALFFISRLCQGDPVDDTSDIELSSAKILPIQERNSYREIRNVGRKKGNKKAKKNGRNRKQLFKKNGEKVKKMRKNKKSIKRNKERKRKNTQRNKNKVKQMKQLKNKRKNKKSIKRNKERKRKNTQRSKNKDKQMKRLKNRRKFFTFKNKNKPNKKNKNIFKKKIKAKNSELTCYELCIRATNFDKQINRTDKKKGIIQNKVDKHKEAYKTSIALLKNIADRSCEPFPDNLTSTNLTQDVNTLSSCSSKIEATCVPPTIPETVKFEGACHTIILELKNESCQAEDSCSTSKWNTFQEESCTKPTQTEKNIKSELKKCKKVLTACKDAEKNALKYIASCPDSPALEPAHPLGENIVRKTLAAENEEIVDQTDTYNPDTGEVILHVPSHGNYTEATFIMDKHSGILMESSDNTCFMRSIPDDIDPHDLTASTNETSEATDLNMETKLHSQMFVDGIASSEDVSKLSPAMIKECENKPIKKITEEKVTERTFNNFQSELLQSVELSQKERQTSTDCNGLDLEKFCSARHGKTCFRWYYAGKFIHYTADVLGCVICCGSPNYEGELCKCDKISSIDNIKTCMKICPTDQGFVDYCGQCYPNLVNRPMPACKNACPPERKLCGGKCWSTSFGVRECVTSGKTECIRSKFPCNGECPEDRFLCDQLCLPKSVEDHYQKNCNGKCIKKTTKCNDECSEGYTGCGDGCVKENGGRSYTCGKKCQLVNKQCNGECSTNNYVACGPNLCIVQELVKKGYRTCHVDVHDGTFIEECLNGTESCNGECVDGFTLCGLYCRKTSDIWTCNGECKPKWKPCTESRQDDTLGYCPKGYINCNGICKHGYHHKKCNGQCIYSRDDCVNKIPCPSMSTTRYKFKHLKNIIRKKEWKN